MEGGENYFFMKSIKTQTKYKNIKQQQKQQQTANLFFYEEPLFLVRGMACLPWLDCSWCW